MAIAAGHKLTLTQALATNKAGVTVLTRRNAGFAECRILQKLDDEFARVQFVDDGHTAVTMHFWEKENGLPFPEARS